MGVSWHNYTITTLETKPYKPYSNRMVKHFSLYFSMTSLFWVFLSSVCFFSLSFVLCFYKSNFIWFSLRTAYLLISEYFIWVFFIVLYKRGILLVTFFVLDWSRPLRCRSADFMFVVGRLDFVFFWWKQHLICTDQNVSATRVDFNHEKWDSHSFLTLQHHKKCYAEKLWSSLEKDV